MATLSWSGLSVLETGTASSDGLPVTLDVVVLGDDHITVRPSHEILPTLTAVTIQDNPLDPGTDKAFAKHVSWQGPFGSGSADVIIIRQPVPEGGDRVSFFPVSGDRFPGGLEADQIAVFIASAQFSAPISPVLRPTDFVDVGLADLRALDHYSYTENDVIPARGFSEEFDTGDGNDTVFTGTGDDTVRTGRDDDTIVIDWSATGFSYKKVDAGPGNDTIDLSQGTGRDGGLYLDLEHWSLGNGIAVDLNAANNSLTIDKGAEGRTTVVDMAAALNGDGLEVVGTSFDDTFRVAPNDPFNRLLLVPGPGNDTVSVIGDAAAIRLTYFFTDATDGLRINLRTGVVENDGFGGRDQLNGRIDRVVTSPLDDVFIGSDAFATAVDFSSTGGNDTFDGGLSEGDDLLFLSSAVDRLEIDAVTGRATGSVNGSGFEVTFSNFEGFAGTGNADRIAGSPNDDRIFGEGGDDTLFGRDGDDFLTGYLGNDFADAGAGDDTLLGGEGSDTLYGGDGNDEIEGSDGNDVIYGGTGDDTIRSGDEDDLVGAGAGSDLIVAAGGRDAVWAGDGNDTALGEEGNDTLGGGAGNDDLSGGAGQDQLWGALGNDSLYGDADDDTLGGAAGDDSLEGGDGNDQIWGALGADFALGGGGNDLIGGSVGNDTLDGGTGDDSLWGAADNDSLTGGAGQDVLGGGAGADVVSGGDGADSLYGGVGNDTLFGGAGNDELYGATGNDSLAAGDGEDRVFAGAGNDTLAGGGGGDALDAGAGNDIVFAGDGNDTVFGTAGNDYLDGGSGADTFVFSAGSGTDTVRAAFADADVIQLSAQMTGGETSAASVITTYSSWLNGVLILTLENGDSLRLVGINTRAELEAMLDII